MAKKTRKDLQQEIEVPEGIEAEVKGKTIIMKKESDEIQKKAHRGIEISKEGNKIIIKTKKAGREKKRNFGTFVGHVKNMIEGLTKGFEYELEICNVHFPMTVDFDKAKKMISINNLLGERVPRTLKISDKVEIEINPPKIIVKSYDIEDAGQTAANLEIVSKVKNRDRNKFQDGIFITKKPRKEFL